MSVGDKIRTARINKKYNQKELADLLASYNIKVGNTTISNWENGTSKPDPDTLEVLCKILEVDANFILGFDSIYEKEQDELDVLFDKTKPYLNEYDKAIIKTILQEKRKEIDKQLGEEE